MLTVEIRMMFLFLCCCLNKLKKYIYDILSSKNVNCLNGLVVCVMQLTGAPRLSFSDNLQ